MVKIVTLGMILLTSFSVFGMSRNGLEKCLDEDLQKLSQNYGLYKHTHVYEVDTDRDDVFDAMSLVSVMRASIRDNSSKTTTLLRNRILNAGTCGELFDVESRKAFLREYDFLMQDKKRQVVANMEILKKIGFDFLAESLKPTHWELNNIIENTTRKSGLAATRKALESYKGMSADAAQKLIDQEIGIESYAQLKKRYLEYVEKMDPVIYGQTAQPSLVQEGRISSGAR